MALSLEFQLEMFAANQTNHVTFRGLFVEFSGPICSGGAFVNSSGRKPRGLDPVLALAPEESS